MPEWRSTIGASAWPTLRHALQNSPPVPTRRLCIHGASAYRRPAEACPFGRVLCPAAARSGHTRVISAGNDATVRLETGYGPVYVRYPARAERLAFVLDIRVQRSCRPPPRRSTESE